MPSTAVINALGAVGGECRTCTPGGWTQQAPARTTPAHLLGGSGGGSSRQAARAAHRKCQAALLANTPCLQKSCTPTTCACPPTLHPPPAPPATAGGVLAACLAPQLYKLWVTKSARDLSYLFLALYNVGLTLTFIYLYYEDALVAWICLVIELGGCGWCLLGGPAGRCGLGVGHTAAPGLPALEACSTTCLPPAAAFGCLMVVAKVYLDNFGPNR